MVDTGGLLSLCVCSCVCVRVCEIYACRQHTVPALVVERCGNREGVNLFVFPPRGGSSYGRGARLSEVLC